MTASAPSPAGSTDRPGTPDNGAKGTLPEPQVRAMFDRIAGVYDRMNAVMTAGLHHQWRRRAADLAAVGPGDRVLDVATGTGDLALELARRVSPGGAVIGADFSERMLELAREKAVAARASLARPGDVVLRFETANALALPYGDGEFDAATVGFGARNFSDLAAGLAEMVRVVRPGGRVVVLEITSPVKPPLSIFYELWFDRLVPALGRTTQAVTRALEPLRRGTGGTGGAPAGGASPIGEAYSYLPNSVKRFPAPAELAAQLDGAGLQEIGYVLLAGGIVAIHAGTVPRR